MKKILTLGVILTLSASMSFAASEFGTAFKNAVKSDIEATKKEAKEYNKAVKESVKKDIEAKAKASQDAKIKEAQEKKKAKLKEVNNKISELNKQRAIIQSSKNMTLTEKTIKTKAIDKQLEYFNKQKEALK